MYRSGSYLPTVEGSLNAIEGSDNGNEYLNEEELRSDPAYLSYYYLNVNLNPRLPPLVMSKEDWRFAQRVQAVGSSKVGGIGDRRKATNNSGNNRADNGEGSRSLFSMQSGFNPKKEENNTQWLDKDGDGLIGLSLGHQKSFAEIFQVFVLAENIKSKSYFHTGSLLLLFSGVGAAFGAFAVPKFEQLTVSSYYAAYSASHYAISQATHRIEEVHASEGLHDKSR